MTIFKIFDNKLISCNIVENEDTLIIPDNVENLGCDCFKGMVNVKKIILNEKIKSLGEVYFRDLPSLEYIDIKNVEFIERKNFCDCKKLKVIKSNRKVKLANNSLLHCFSLKEINAGEDELELALGDTEIFDYPLTNNKLNVARIKVDYDFSKITNQSDYISNFQSHYFTRIKKELIFNSGEVVIASHFEGLNDLIEYIFSLPSTENTGSLIPPINFNDEDIDELEKFFRYDSSEHLYFMLELQRSINNLTDEIDQIYNARKNRNERIEDLFSQLYLDVLENLQRFYEDLEYNFETINNDLMNFFDESEKDNIKKTIVLINKFIDEADDFKNSIINKDWDKFANQYLFILNNEILCEFDDKLNIIIEFNLAKHCKCESQFCKLMKEYRVSSVDINNLDVITYHTGLTGDLQCTYYENNHLEADDFFDLMFQYSDEISPTHSRMSYLYDMMSFVLYLKDREKYKSCVKNSSIQNPENIQFVFPLVINNKKQSEYMWYLCGIKENNLDYYKLMSDPDYQNSSIRSKKFNIDIVLVFDIERMILLHDLESFKFIYNLKADMSSDNNRGFSFPNKTIDGKDDILDEDVFNSITKVYHQSND